MLRMKIDTNSYGNMAVGLHFYSVLFFNAWSVEAEHFFVSGKSVEATFLEHQHNKSKIFSVT